MSIVIHVQSICYDLSIGANYMICKSCVCCTIRWFMHCTNIKNLFDSVEFFMNMNSNICLLTSDIPRCDHLTVHIVMCPFCGMVVYDDCIYRHKLIHIANGEKKISETEYEN